MLQQRLSYLAKYFSCHTNDQRLNLLSKAISQGLIMKKTLKFIAIFVLLLIIIIIAGFTALSLYINPNDYKQEIEQAAFDNANIQLKINGDISWSIYPNIGLDIQEIAANYQDKAPLASLTNANVSVMLMPLLSGEVKVKGVTIEGLKLNLIQDKDSNNWQGEQTQVADPSSSTTTPEQAAQTASSFEFNKIAVDNIDIKDSTVVYTDLVNDSVSTVNNVNFNSQNIALNQPFDAQLSFDAQLKSNGKQTLASKVELSGNFLVELAKQHFQINNLNTQLSVTTDQTIDLNLQANIDADLAKNAISVNNLAVKSGDMNAKGALKIKGEQLDNLEGLITVERFDLKKLLTTLKLAPIATNDDKALRSIALTTQIAGSVSKLDFKQLLISVDDTKISGSANYQLSNGFINFALKGDHIDTNRYLPPVNNNTATNNNSTNTTAGTAKTTSDGAYSKEDIIPVDVLKSLKLAGNITFAGIDYQKTKLTNVLVNINADNGLVKIPNLDMQAYQGSISNNITLDARKTPLKLQINNNINTLSIGPVLQDFAQTDALTGSLSSSTNLTATGQSIHSIVNSLNGKVQLSLTDGVVKGIDAAQQMCETVNQISSLGGIVNNTQSVDKSTAFATIKGLLNFKNGVISNNDFKADLDALNATGKGSINLPAQSLDYRVGLTIQDNLFKKSCSVNNKIQDIEWPVNCRGGFNDDPLDMCKPDLSVVEDVLKNALKAELEEKLGASIEEKSEELKQELKSKVEEKAKDKLKDALKGLF